MCVSAISLLINSGINEEFIIYASTSVGSMNWCTLLILSLTKSVVAFFYTLQSFWVIINNNTK